MNHQLIYDIIYIWYQYNMTYFQQYSFSHQYNNKKIINKKIIKSLQFLNKILNFLAIFGNQEQGDISNSLNFFLFNRKSLSKHQFLILRVEEVWFRIPFPEFFEVSAQNRLFDCRKQNKSLIFPNTWIHAVIEKYSIILRIRNKSNAFAFRSRTSNENHTVPLPLFPYH